MRQKKVRCPDRAKKRSRKQIKRFLSFVNWQPIFSRNENWKKTRLYFIKRTIKFETFRSKKNSSLKVFRGKISTFNKLDSKLVSHISGWLEPRLAEAPENTQPQKVVTFLLKTSLDKDWVRKKHPPNKKIWTIDKERTSANNFFSRFFFIINYLSNS